MLLGYTIPIRDLPESEVFSLESNPLTTATSTDNDDSWPERFRAYLRLLADQQVRESLRNKVDLSGVVQETLLQAYRELQKGTTIAVHHRPAWIRAILSHNLADEIRRLTAAKRDVQREVSLQRELEESSQDLESWLAQESPPDRTLQLEELLQRASHALMQLPQSQRDAVLLYHRDGLPLHEVALQLGRSREAVAGLLKRGLKQLRLELNRD